MGFLWLVYKIGISMLNIFLNDNFNYFDRFIV